VKFMMKRILNQEIFKKVKSNFVVGDGALC